MPRANTKMTLATVSLTWFLLTAMVTAHEAGRHHRHHHRRARQVVIPSDSAPYLEVDYGGRHPFELMKRARENKDAAAHRRLQFTSDDDYKPIRIVVEAGKTFAPPTNAIGEFILGELVPRVLGLWTSAVRTFPVQGDLKAGFDNLRCNGVGRYSNTDLVVYVGTDGGSLCDVFVDPEPFDFVCQKDIYGRPTAGNLEICTDFLDVNDSQSKENAIATANRYMAHILGFVSTSFADYHDRYTGLPRTPDRVESTVECVTGITTTVALPSEQVLQKVTNPQGESLYALVTPAVVNAVRNQFDCQTMVGAPLENTLIFADECLGSNWETRLFPTELMAGSSFFDLDIGGFITKLTPMTLAVLEDTGWYVVDYSTVESSASLFGFGRGCDFVEKPCLVDAQVPDYGKGFFCADNVGTFPEIGGCTPDRLKIAGCFPFDYGEQVPAAQRYFPDDPRWGGSDLADYCPLFDLTVHPLLDEDGGESFVDFSCADKSIPQNFGSGTVFEDVETFGKSSRCVESDLGRPICLKHSCNAETRKVEFKIKKKTYVCDEAGQEVEAGDATFICPDLKEVCPELVCPNLCSARGTCDFSTGTCTCIDPEDDSPDCVNTALGEYPEPPPPCPAWTFAVGDGKCQALCRKRDGLELDAATGTCQPLCDAKEEMAYDRQKGKCVSSKKCGLGTVVMKKRCPKVCKSSAGLGIKRKDNVCTILCDANMGLTFDMETETCVSTSTCPVGKFWTGTECQEPCDAAVGLMPSEDTPGSCLLLCDAADNFFFHVGQQECVKRRKKEACEPGQLLRNDTKCSANCSRNSGLTYDAETKSCVSICEEGFIYNTETKECQGSI